MMKKSFGSRRVARKIGGDEEDDSVSSQTITSPADAGKSHSDQSAGAVSDPNIIGQIAKSVIEPSSVVKRPSNKSRKSSSLRTSFGTGLPGDDDENSSSIVTPKRNNLSRVAIQRNAEKRGAADIPFRVSRDDDEERPSYNKNYLEELKQSTPSTPRELSAPPTGGEVDVEPSRAIDITSKFGKDISRYNPPSAIPTDAEIKEKKERRARLAKEENYMSLDASDEGEESDENVTRDEDGRLILKPKEKYPETRLVRDDEDILEDFDDFTSDGRIALGQKAEHEARTKKRSEMAAMIADAEGISDDEDEADESEVERIAAFDVAQTRNGTYASRAAEKDEMQRPRTPPRIAPLPTIDSVMDRLRKRLEDMQVAKMHKIKESESLKAEKKQIAEEEVRVQTALKETGEKYAKLRKDMGITNEETQLQLTRHNGTADDDDVAFRPGLGNAGLGSTPMSARGLESLGSTPMTMTPARDGSDENDY